jgi:NTP pyrophosphatase (non-canonical NTP hydrolase)
MNILILKEITTHGKKISFKDVTINEQMSFIIGEVQELDNAVLFLEGHNTISDKERVAKEGLDVIQTVVQLLDILEREGTNIKDMLKSHNMKLVRDRKGISEVGYYLQKKRVIRDGDAV